MIDVEMELCLEKHSQKNNLFQNSEKYLYTIDFENFKECSKHLILKEKLRKFNSISLRKGMILALEERIQLETKERENFTFRSIQNSAIKTFSIRNKNTKRFKTLDDTHPKDPCLKYEYKGNNIKFKIESGLKADHYKRTLKEILENKFWLIDEEQVNDSLQNYYYKEIFNCTKRVT